MAGLISGRLAGVVLLILLVIEPTIEANTEENKGQGLIQLAQKDFGVFLRHATESAGNSIIKTLNSKFKDKFSYALQEADVDTLRIWQGQALDVSLDVNTIPHRIYTGGPQNEDQWLSLRRLLPQSQGGIRLHADWDAIESNLVRPLRDGPVLSDFTVEGPLDLFFTPPADLQLWLPHNVDAGIQKRVMLHDGAALTVRGARSVQLRRAVDLPDISLSDFVDFALDDKKKQQAAGLMHLGTGLRKKAEIHWNKTEKNKLMTPALVGLEIDFSSSVVGSGKAKKKGGQGTLFAAPNEHGALQRLRVKRMGDGILEISVRRPGNAENNSGAGGGSGDGRMSIEESKALVLGRPGSPYVWPFRSASPETVKTYEHLLRELLSRQIFSSSSPAGTSVAPEVPLKLRHSSSTAVFLMKMELAVMRKPIQASISRINEKEENKKDRNLPTPGQLLRGGPSDSSDAQPRREVYSVVVEVAGSARDLEGLRFSPVGPLELVERAREKTATFDMPAALSQVAGELGLGMVSNVSRVRVKDEL